MTAVRTLAALLLSAMVAGCARTPDFDIVIRGGDVYDGDPIAPRRVDVGVKGDRITAVGNLAGRTARQIIDASGRAVSPGFIDAFSASGATLLADGSADSHIRQGITTEILGLDTPAYWTAATAPAAAVSLLQRFGIPITWTGISQYFDQLEQRGTSVNVATLVPVIPLDAAETLTRRVDQGMRAGALGICVSSAVPADIVRRAARASGSSGGAYVATLGPDAPGGAQIANIVSIAEAAGLREAIVMVDLESPEQATALGDVAGEFPRNRSVYLMAGTSGYAAGQDGSQQLRTLLSWGGTMIGTGTPAVRADGALAAATSRAAAFGAFPRVVGRLVRDNYLTLAMATYRSSGLPAAHFHLSQRGHLRPGYFADIVIFNPVTLADRPTGEDPAQYPSGIDYVLVNGVLTVTPAGHTGARAGRTLAGPAAGRS